MKFDVTYSKITKKTLNLDTNKLLKEAIKYCQEDSELVNSPLETNNDYDLADYLYDFLRDYCDKYVDDAMSEIDYYDRGSLDWGPDFLDNVFYTIKSKLIKELEKRKLLKTQEDIKEESAKVLNEEIKELQKQLKNKKEELKQLKGEIK